MRKKRGHNRGKRLRYQIIIPLAVLFLAAVIAGFWAGYSKYRGSDIVFEESYKYASNLQKKITEVEKAIYEAFYKSDLKEKDILFSAVLPRHERGNDWEFTELIVHLPETTQIEEVQRIIGQSLAGLYPSVHYNIAESSKKRVVLDIYALGCYTHRIKLLSKPGPSVETERKPRVAIIIDDLGYDLKRAVAFINFEPGLSLSVLPQAPYSREIVQMALKHKRDVLLHLPMEPKNYPHINPGPGTLLTTMSDETLVRNVDLLLDSIDGIAGVNNHMGSAFTEREDKMAVVLREIARRDLFFVDSRTTAKSVAFGLAEELGVKAAKRSVFIDNELTPQAMKYQMERLFGLARHSSGVIGIAHPHRMTLELFKHYQDRFKNEIELIPVSAMVH